MVISEKVFVTGSGLDPAALERLSSSGLDVVLCQEDLSLQGLRDRLTGSHFYLYGGDEPANEFESSAFVDLRAGGLRHIAFAGKGVRDFLDVDAARAAGITVSNTPGAVEPSVAEFTLQMIGLALRGTIAHVGAWWNSINPGASATGDGRPIPLGRDMADCEFGIVGLGDIGRLVALRLRHICDRPIRYYSRTRKTDLEDQNVVVYNDLDQLLRTCDVVTVHLDNRPETQQLMANAPWEEAKRGVVLVNSASQALFDSARLATLLRSGVFGAAVFDKIYPAKELTDSGLLDCIPSQLVVTSHLANRTVGAWRRMTAAAVDSILDAASEHVPIRNSV